MGVARAIGGVSLAIGIVLSMVGVATMATSYSDESADAQGEGALLEAEPADGSDRDRSLFMGGIGTLAFGLAVIVVGGILLAVGGRTQQQTVVIKPRP